MFSNSLSAKLKFLGPSLGKGGVVYNETTKDIQISSDSYVMDLPAGKSSMEVGIKDVDAIIIDDDKVLKFCNYGVIEVKEPEPDKITIKTKKLSWICKLAKDYDVYSSVKEAFGQLENENRNKENQDTKQ